MLLIRQDAIGDFVLWLDTAKEYRKSYHPENYKIVLVGNALWCDFVKGLPFWDEVLLVNVKALHSFAERKTFPDTCFQVVNQSFQILDPLDSKANGFINLARF